jgi:hypothetical protein
MTKEELDKFEKELQSKGYEKAHNSAYHSWYKKFTVKENKNAYQICFDFWDFSPYTKEDDYLTDFPYSVSSTITVNGADLEIDYTNNIDEIEQLAESFFKWVEDNIKII